MVEQEALELERELCRCYGPFNPDRDTIAPRTLDGDGAGGDGLLGEVERRLGHLLTKCNFQRLSEAGIDDAIRIANSHGLRVRLRAERIEQLSIWVRGRGAARRRRRTLRHPLRGVEGEFQVYRRLAVVARMRGESHLLLKLFKDIPVGDVEALLPHAEVRMGWFDRLKVFGGGAGIVWSSSSKVLNLLTGLIAWTKLMWVLLIGFVVLTVRTLLGYRVARIERDSQRTRNLYYQNLANNAGVVHSLAFMVAQEELKEALLAYAICWCDSAGPVEAGAHGGGAADRDAVARRIRLVADAYLREEFGVAAVFDAADALATLVRIGLCCDPDSGRVKPPAAAIDVLTSHVGRSAKRSGEGRRT
ncbi:MAG: hypothetical protein CHACPFDD_02861 [Phycisphaerae bacterium]|nr:hypothetical protein [Phycisphaerae bacterium]